MLESPWGGGGDPDDIVRMSAGDEGSEGKLCGEMGVLAGGDAMRTVLVFDDGRWTIGGTVYRCYPRK